MLLKRKKLSMLVALLSSTVGAAALAPQVFAQDENDDMLEEVIVSGFRAAQAAALENKRSSTNSVESIIAEDIGKMPDLNLAESLQRSPGVAITREGGEGRQITVRGLGPQYTRVTLNGMEVPASTGGLDSSGGVNRGRSFDFNIFSADLFRQIDINKNSVAHIEEGGLASTVELYTMRPLDKPGLNMTGAAQGGYNIHTGELDPRLTGMISNTFMDDKVGVLVGLNYSERTVHQEGFGTVRWTGPASNFRGCSPAYRGWGSNGISLSGANPTGNYSASTIAGHRDDTDNWNALSFDDRMSECGAGDLDPADPDYQEDYDALVAHVTPDADYLDDLDYMWAPRLPRMDSFNHDQTRIGFLAAVQAQPTDELELNLNVMTSNRDSDVKSYNYFAQFRNMHNTLEPTSVSLDSGGRYITAGTFENVQPRSESRGQFSTSDFTQVVGSASYDFSDTLSLDVMLGSATSEHKEEQYRYNLTASEGSEFSYSFDRNSNVAEMSYGFDILNPTNYSFSGPTHRQESVKRENTTFKADLTWEFDDAGSNVKGGFIVNERSIDSRFSDDTVGLTSPNTPSGTNTNSLSDEVGSYGDGIDGPSGFPTDWLVADFDVVRDEYNAGEWNPEPNDSRTYIVNEDTMGGYVEANYYVGDFTLNGGLRFVETTVSGNKSDLEESYTNTLPALNITYEPIDDVLIRGAYSKNLARPNPANLSGAVNATPINGNVSVANPGLNPETADSLDIAVEWYFAEESYVGLTLFQKKISDAITSETLENVTLPADIQAIIADDPAYDPNSPSYEPSAIQPGEANAWNLTRSTNSTETDKINGYELGFNYMLPMGVGFLANYTKLDTDSTITGLSENSYNLGVFYEQDRYAARLVLNSRDDYITDFTGSNGNAEHANTGPTRLDFSGSYSLNDNIDFTLEVINLTNEKERLYTTGPMGDLDLVREYNTTGTELIFGVRASF